MRRLWTASVSGAKAARFPYGSKRATKDQLRLSNGAVLMQGIEEIALQDQVEIHELPRPTEHQIFTRVKFPSAFVSPPSVLLSYGPPHSPFSLGAEQISTQSFTIAISAMSSHPTLVMVSWQAVGFVTFGDVAPA